jgi:hypothetical protein
MNIGDRVEIPCYCDLWMRGAMYGVIVKIKDTVATVKMDHPQVKRAVRVVLKDCKSLERGK